MSDYDEDETETNAGDHELHELVFATALGVDLEEEYAAELVDLAVEALYVLPDGWEVRFIDSEMGKLPYFFDTETKRKYWTHPFIEDLKNLIVEKRLELADDQGSYVTLDSLASSQVKEQNLERMREKKSPRLRISPRISPRAGTLDQSIKQIVEESKLKDTGIESASKSITSTPKISPRVISLSEKSKKGLPRSQKSSPKDSKKSTPEKQASAKKESAAVSPSPRASNKATPEKPSSTKKESVEISSSPKASEKSTPEKKSLTKEEKSELSPTEEVKSLVAAQISSTPPKSESISVVNEEKEDIPAVSEESKQDSPKLKQESPTPLPESPKFQPSEEEKHLTEPQPIAVIPSEVHVAEALVEDNKLSGDSPVIEVAVVAPPDSAIVISTEDKVTDLEGNSIASIHSEGKDEINAAVDSLDAKEKLSEVEIQAEKDLIQAAAANSLNTEEKLSEVEIQTELKEEEEEKMVTDSPIENEIETVESLHDKVLSPKKSDEKIETETFEAERQQEPLLSDQLEIQPESERLTKTEVESEVQLEEAESAAELTTISDPAIYTLVGTSIIENILLEAKVKAEQFLMNRLREEAEKEKQAIRRGVSELIEEILQIFEEQEKAEKERRRTEISGMIETMLASVESKLVKDIVEEREALERARIAAEEQAKEDEKLAEMSDHEPLPDSEAVEDILNESHESLRSIHTLAPEKEADLAMLEEIRSIHEEQGEDNQSLGILLSPIAEVTKQSIKSSTPTPTSLGSQVSQTPSLISKRSPFAAIILEEKEAPDLQPKSLFKDEFPDFFKVETSMIEALDQHPRKKNGPRKPSNVSGSSISTVTTKSSSSQKKSQAVPSYFSATSASDQKKVLKKQTSANGGLKTFSSKSRHPEHDGEYYEDEEEDEEQETLDIDQIFKLDQKPKVDPFTQTVDKESEPIFTGTADSVMESSLANLEDDQIPPLEDEEDGDITARISDLLNDDRFPQLPPVSLDKSKDITEHFKQMFPTVASDEKSLKSQKSFTSKRSALKSKMRREVSDLSVGSSLSGPRDAKNITPSPAGHMKMMRKVSIISREFAIDHLDQELAVPEQIIETAPSTAPSSSSITKKKKRRPKSPTTITGVTGWITIEAYNHYKDAERAIEILESFYPVQPLNKDVISCSSKLFPNLQELTNQQSFHPSPSKGNTSTGSSSLSNSFMESGNHNHHNLPLLQNHPHNISPPSSAQQHNKQQQQIPQAEVLNKLKAFETLQKTSKTIQINLEKELPKLRITRDFSKMQWIIECNDKSVKRLFQQRLHTKWPINGATSTMNSASPMKRPPQQQTNFDSTTGSAFSPNRMEDSVDLLKTSMSSKSNNNNNNNGNTSNSSLTEGFMTTNVSNNAYQGEYKASFTLQSFMTSSNSKHVSSVVPVTYHIPKAQLNRLKELPLSSSPNRLNNSSSDHHRRHGGGMRLTSAGKLSMLNAQVQSMASFQHLQTLDPTISYNTPLAFLTKANSFQESNDISNNQSFSSLIFARPKSLN
eukprot:CAMPEP_0173166578 /NCGR_PEP_ID=MMETSP1105-20130129/22101_1 /TAXON_ID=2985 /ORGANISM="Ochromonas sp., Strain BG-1" /LENGTH=1505 /DNA_ID=CAMNT_0014087855 /DNA_START=25 /DNA_END=4542 /DNA_ORIENTATION=+